MSGGRTAGTGEEWWEDCSPTGAGQVKPELRAVVTVLALYFLHSPSIVPPLPGAARSPAFARMRRMTRLAHAGSLGSFFGPRLLRPARPAQAQPGGIAAPPIPAPPAEFDPALDVKPPPPTLDDPFQQPLRKEPKPLSVATTRPAGLAAFAAKRYAQAAALFVEATSGSRERLTAAQRTSGPTAGSTRSGRNSTAGRWTPRPQQPSAARLRTRSRPPPPGWSAFGNQLLDEIRQRTSETVVAAAATESTGWT